jgi:RNA recognition motif-containing protein
MVTRTKKIFVGGLSAPTTLEDVKSYFEQFGTVSTFYLLPPTRARTLLLGPSPASEGNFLRRRIIPPLVLSEEKESGGESICNL